MTKRSELVLPPGTYAYSLDRANAQLSVLVGPLQNKLEELEGTVTFDAQKGRMVGCPIDRAIKPLVIVPTGSYAIVTNPYVADGKVSQPPLRKKTQVSEVELQYGRTVHIEGPTALVPWPGQDVTVQEGYRLNHDQYLYVEVTGSLDQEGTALCDRLGIPAGCSIVRGSLPQLPQPFIPATGMRVLGGQKAVKTAVRLGPLDWARVGTHDGSKTYRYGETLLFPEPDETVEQIGTAYDLRTCGLHIRRLGLPAENSRQDCDEQFLTLFGETTTAQPFYWPNVHEVILATLEPIEVPVGGGVYIRAAGSTDVAICGKAGPVLFNPLEYELVERDGSAFAPAIVVQDNEAVEINSPTGTRYLTGPQTELLGYSEQEGRRVNITEQVELQLEGVCSDAVPVKLRYEFTLSCLGETASWFGIVCPTRRAITLLQHAFTHYVAKHASADLSTEMVAKQMAEVELPDVQVTDRVTGELKLTDEEISKLVKAAQRSETINRWTVHTQLQEADRRRAEERHASALAELDEKLAILKTQAGASTARAEAERHRLTLEFKRAQQDLLDEISKFELDREACKAQQALELKAKQDELERKMLNAKAEASAALLNAIQPDLVAAIRAAGAQTAFGKVVQHLGPSAILSGVGLQDAVKRIIGDDAASSMLLTDMRPPDKPNGGSKRPSAES